MRNEEVVKAIAAAITHQGASTAKDIKGIYDRLDKVDGILAVHETRLGGHDTMLALIRQIQGSSAENWTDVRGVVIDGIKILMAAILGALLAGKITV